MQTKQIFDSDFIPSYIYNNATHTDIYQLIYGIFYHANPIKKLPEFPIVHDVIISLCKSYKSSSYKKIKQKMLIAEIDNILNNLKKYVNKNFPVLVLIPVYEYENRLETVIELFDFSKLLLEEMVSNPDSNYELESNIVSLPIPTMGKMYYDYYQWYIETDEEDVKLQMELHPNQFNSEAHSNNLEEFKSIFGNEFIRRGLETDDDKVPFIPSMEHLDSSTFRDLFISPEQEFVLSDLYSEEPMSSEETVSLKQKAAVLYYILSEFGVDKKVIGIIANYVSNIPYSEEKKKKLQNSLRRYMYLYESFDIDMVCMDYIRETFSHYGLELPNKLVIKKPHKLD